MRAGPPFARRVINQDALACQDIPHEMRIQSVPCKVWDIPGIKKARLRMALGTGSAVSLRKLYQSGVRSGVDFFAPRSESIWGPAEFGTVRR